MPSNLQVTNLKANDGTAGISIADSTGRVSFTETNPTITLGSNTTFPAGHILQVQYMSTGTDMTSTGAYVELLNGAYITITKIAGSNIFLSWSTQIGKANNVYSQNTKIERADNSSFTSSTNINQSPQVAIAERTLGSAGYTGDSAYNYPANWGHTTIDNSITSNAGTYYYRVWFDSTGDRLTCAQDGGISVLYAMEIKT